MQVVDINPPISENPTNSVVKGKSGKLYIGKSKVGFLPSLLSL